MRLQKLCSVIIILLLSIPVKPADASSNPRIVATYLNWEISLFYDQNVKSCVAISKGNYYQHPEPVVAEESAEEEVKKEAIDENDKASEFEILKKPTNIGEFDYGVDGNPIENKNSSIYDFGKYSEDLIKAKPSIDDADTKAPALITSQEEPETPEEVIELPKIDTDKILAEARAEYEGKQSTEAKNLQKGVFLITSWPKRREYFDISIRPQALLKSDEKSWLIFPDQSRFVLTQSKLDAKPNPYLRTEIINRLRENRFAEVVNYAQDGKQLRYYYDLRGIEYALSALIKFCPLPHYPE